MITEQEIVDDLLSLEKKLVLLVDNRRNNPTFWKDILSKIQNLIKIIRIDKKIYGW